MSQSEKTYVFFEGWGYVHPTPLNPHKWEPLHGIEEGEVIECKSTYLTTRQWDVGWATSMMPCPNYHKLICISLMNMSSIFPFQCAFTTIFSRYTLGEQNSNKNIQETCGEKTPTSIIQILGWLNSLNPFL